MNFTLFSPNFYVKIFVKAYLTVLFYSKLTQFIEYALRIVSSIFSVDAFSNVFFFLLNLCVIIKSLLSMIQLDLTMYTQVFLSFHSLP